MLCPQCLGMLSRDTMVIQNARNEKKKELLPVGWHSSRLWDWSNDKIKEIENLRCLNRKKGFCRTQLFS